MFCMLTDTINQRCPAHLSATVILCHIVVYLQSITKYLIPNKKLFYMNHVYN